MRRTGRQTSSHSGAEWRRQAGDAGGNHLQSVLEVPGRLSMPDQKQLTRVIRQLAQGLGIALLLLHGPPVCSCAHLFAGRYVLSLACVLCEKHEL